MRAMLLAVAAGLFAALPAAAQAPSPAPLADLVRAVDIPHQQFTLRNGLRVIVHEDRKAPIVAVSVWYGVGAADEPAGKTGFAHLFEHLMFMGTRRAPTKAFDAWMEAAGGWNNAWTSQDRTDYYDVGPPSSVDLLLWLEADRLRDLGPLMTKEKLDAQREVVRNERRQTSENRPYGKVELRMPELLYPPGHPYHHPVIGSHADLEAATVDDVKQFFERWYDPANASIAVAGDVDPARVTARVKELFGAIPSRGKPQDPGAPGFSDTKTTLTQVVRETIEDDVELAKVSVVWQSPKHFGPGDAELDLLATALANGKASRLYQSLVYDLKLAQSVEAAQDSGTLGSQFRVEVLARPGTALDKLEAALDKELEKVRSAPLAAEELDRAKNVVETAFVARLESVRERASLLNMYQAEVGDPAFLPRDLARYRAATREGVRDVAKQVLLPNARVIVHAVPRAKAAPAKGGAK